MIARIPYGRTGDDMDLPPGKTCGDCVHCRRCTAIFGHIPEDESCDWSPSRFREAQQTNSHGAEAQPFITNKGSDMTTMAQLFGKLRNNGGCIVSSGDCSTMEIADAQARGDFTVDEDGFGYVLRPQAWLQKHSRFASGATDSCEQRGG